MKTLDFMQATISYDPKDPHPKALELDCLSRLALRLRHRLLNTRTFNATYFKGIFSKSGAAFLKRSEEGLKYQALATTKPRVSVSFVTRIICFSYFIRTHMRIAGQRNRNGPESKISLGNREFFGTLKEWTLGNLCKWIFVPMTFVNSSWLPSLSLSFQGLATERFEVLIR
jgi:hypothetical protein